MQHMRRIPHRFTCILAIPQRSLHTLQPRPRLQNAVVTERPHGERIERRISQKSIDECTANLPCCASHQNAFRLTHAALASLNVCCASWHVMPPGLNLNEDRKSTRLNSSHL